MNPARVHDSPQTRVRYNRSYGIFERPERVDSTSHLDRPGNRAGHRQHRVYLDFGRQTARRAAGASAHDRFAPCHADARGAPLFDCLAGRAHRAAVRRARPGNLRSRPHLDGGRDVFALQGDAGDSRQVGGRAGRARAARGALVFGGHHANRSARHRFFRSTRSSRRWAWPTNCG